MKTSYFRFFLSFIALCLVATQVLATIDPAMADLFAFLSPIDAGVSTAAMMAIGDIADVSDRQTHGSNIAYKAYLIELSQINPDIDFPKPNNNREVATIPMRKGQYMTYFEAHDVPTFTATGEKGDITTSGENNFVMIMGGMRDELLNFIEQHAGGKFVILFKEVAEKQWYIIGNYDRPMILTSYEAKNDKDGRYVTFTFKRTSIDQYCKYIGDIVRTPATSHTADQTSLAIKPESGRYAIPAGTAATYAIESVSGLSANDKGRTITLEGTAQTNAPTISDNTTFILEDGSTWTAKAGSTISFRVLDPSTLIEVPGSRIQTV